MKEISPPPAKARLRRLSAEEIELWLAVTKSIARRPGAILPQPDAPRETDCTPAPTSVSEPVGREASPPTGAAPVPERRPMTPLAPLDRRSRQRLARGRIAPDAAIDLHGMHRHDAFVALRAFLAKAQIEGARLVLVVTGKGERGGQSSGETGILRRSVPQWLNCPDLRSIVVGFEEASRSHGGTGALYVRIRRRDKAAR